MTSELVGTLEIAQLLNVSRQRADQLTKTDDLFPQPAAELAAGRVWHTEAVVTWARFRERPIETSPMLPRNIRALVEASRAILTNPTDPATQATFRKALETVDTGGQSARHGLGRSARGE
jgi:prophage regulatory protein